MTAARHPVVTFLLVGLFVLDVASGTKYIQKYLQGGPSARGTQFVDIKLKVPPQYEPHIQSGVAYHSQGFED